MGSKMKQYPNNAGYKEPTTSKKSAETVPAKTIRKKCLMILRNKMQYGDGATPDEIANLLNISILSVRPRFSELKLKDCIEDTGKTRTNESTKQAKVWRYLKDE